MFATRGISKLGEAIMEMIYMQGYGFYVWGSVLVTVGILVGNFWYARYQMRKIKYKLKENNTT